MRRPLVIAILAKSTAHSLPLYLKSIEAQTVLSKDTIFYIRTNDNRDNTADILHNWYLKNRGRWKIYFDDSSVDESIAGYLNHDWEDHKRFIVLGNIRQQSVDFAISEKADYFTADADNLILPHAISTIKKLHLPVVAPFLATANPASMYSNYHTEIDVHGYMGDSTKLYDEIWFGAVKGIIEVPVVHCTYLIKNKFLPAVKYNDESYRYEYVIFSDELRKKNVPQFIDNREVYGTILSSVNEEEHEIELTYERVRKHVHLLNKKLHM